MCWFIKMHPYVPSVVDFMSLILVVVLYIKSITTDRKDMAQCEHNWNIEVTQFDDIVCHENLFGLATETALSVFSLWAILTGILLLTLFANCPLYLLGGLRMYS